VRIGRWWKIRYVPTFTSRADWLEKVRVLVEVERGEMVLLVDRVMSTANARMKKSRMVEV
jgi:hypothetical protein